MPVAASRPLVEPSDLAQRYQSVRALSAAIVAPLSDADATVHPRNGAALVSAALGSGRTAPRVTEGRSAQGHAFTRSEYLARDGSVAVEHWRLHGAGHAWSGGSTQGSFTDPTGSDASAEMLRFFLAHPRAAGPT